MEFRRSARIRHIIPGDLWRRKAEILSFRNKTNYTYRDSVHPGIDALLIVPSGERQSS